MLLVVVRMEFHAERNLARREPMDDVARFGVPQLQVTIVAGRHELGALVVERHIFDGLPMSKVRSNAASLSVHFPQFHPAIHRRGQQQMRRFRHKLNRRYAFRVSGPRVNVRFGQETLVGRRIRSQIDTNVVRSVQEGASLVVERVFDWKINDLFGN